MKKISRSNFSSIMEVFSMDFDMLRSAKKLEVVYSIIILYAVNMMNDIIRSKQYAHVFLQDKMRSENIAVVFMCGMFRCFYISISFAVGYASFPIRAFLSNVLTFFESSFWRLSSYHCRIVTFFRAILSPIIFNYTRPCLKFISAYFAWFKNWLSSFHDIPLIKKAVFSRLKKLQNNFNYLLTAIFTQKKAAISLASIIILMLLCLSTPVYAWNWGSGFNEGNLNLQKNKLQGDSTTGIYIDPDADLVVEATIGTDGSYTAATGTATFLAFAGDGSALTGVTGGTTSTADGAYLGGNLTLTGYLSANGDITTGDIVWFSTVGGIRDNGNGDMEFTENNGGAWSDLGSGAGLSNIVDSVDGVMISGDASASGNVSSDTLNVRIINMDGTGTLNLLDAIDSTTETTLETYLDITSINKSLATAEAIRFEDWSNSVNSLSISGNSTFWNDLTVDGTLSANIFQAPSGGTGDLQIAGSVSISDDLSVNGEIHTDYLIIMPLSFNTSVSDIYLVSDTFPFAAGTVTDWSIHSEEALAGVLTVSTYLDTTEKTTTKASRASVDSTQEGSVVTGLSIPFTSSDKIRIKLQDYSNSTDLTATGWAHIWAEIKDTK